MRNYHVLVDYPSEEYFQQLHGVFLSLLMTYSVFHKQTHHFTMAKYIDFSYTSTHHPLSSRRFCVFVEEHTHTLTCLCG